MSTSPILTRHRPFTFSVQTVFILAGIRVGGGEWSDYTCFVFNKGAQAPLDNVFTVVTTGQEANRECMMMTMMVSADAGERFGVLDMPAYAGASGEAARGYNSI